MSSSGGRPVIARKAAVTYCSSGFRPADQVVFTIPSAMSSTRKITITVPWNVAVASMLLFNMTVVWLVVPSIAQYFRIRYLGEHQYCETLPPLDHLTETATDDFSSYSIRRDRPSLTSPYHSAHRLPHAALRRRPVLPVR